MRGLAAMVTIGFLVAAFVAYLAGDEAALTANVIGCLTVGSLLAAWTIKEEW